VSTTHPITDRQAEALLRGMVPADQPGLESLAYLMTALRWPAHAAPQPSAALAARLGHTGSSRPNRRGGNL